MKNYVWIAIAMLFAVVCIFQQIWIFSQYRKTPTSATTDPIPQAAYDIELLSRSLQTPEGAKSIGSSESDRLGGSAHSEGFEGVLWIDTSGVEFDGRAKDFREERAAVIGAHYARQVESVIPGSHLSRAVDGPGMAERGSLCSTFVVRHRLGVVSLRRIFAGEMAG